MGIVFLVCMGSDFSLDRILVRMIRRCGTAFGGRLFRSHWHTPCACVVLAGASPLAPGFPGGQGLRLIRIRGGRFLGLRGGDILSDGRADFGSDLLDAVADGEDELGEYVSVHWCAPCAALCRQELVRLNPVFYPPNHEIMGIYVTTL